MSRSPAPAPSGDDPSSSLLRRSFVTGLALAVPIVLTLVVLQFALNVVSGFVAPVVAAFEFVFGPDEAPAVVVEVATVATLAVLVLLIGLVGEEGWSDGWVAAEFDAFMSKIPGLGSVYSGTRQVSEMLIEGDTESFQEVKLVEYPREGAFMLGFLTAEPPEAVRTAAGVGGTGDAAGAGEPVTASDAGETVGAADAGETATNAEGRETAPNAGGTVEAADAGEMVTLFVPLAPNPVMGGFLAFFPADRVHDVDLSVEEGLQAILTSGAAVDPRAAEEEEAGGDAEATERAEAAG